MMKQEAESLLHYPKGTHNPLACRLACSAVDRQDLDCLHLLRSPAQQTGSLGPREAIFMAPHQAFILYNTTLPPGDISLCNHILGH